MNKYYIPKPKVTAICKTCGKTFNTRQNKPLELCVKCRLAVWQKEYYQKKKLEPEFVAYRKAQSGKYINLPKKKLYEAKIALDRLLDRVQKQREKINALEGKNG